jgi:hypothetical protein
VQPRPLAHVELDALQVAHQRLRELVSRHRHRGAGIAGHDPIVRPWQAPEVLRPRASPAREDGLELAMHGRESFGRVLVACAFEGRVVPLRRDAQPAEGFAVFDVAPPPPGRFAASTARERGDRVDHPAWVLDALVRQQRGDVGQGERGVRAAADLRERAPWKVLRGVAGDHLREARARQHRQKGPVRVADAARREPGRSQATHPRGDVFAREVFEHVVTERRKHVQTEPPLLVGAGADGGHALRDPRRRVLRDRRRLSRGAVAGHEIA